MRQSRLFHAIWSLTLAAAVAGPLAAQTIEEGIDVWTTKNDGNTWIDFTNNPLPRDFFCEGSPSFSQIVQVKGLPLTTSPAGVLKGSDTVIHRLQDLTFDAQGVGTTSIEVKAVCFQERQTLSVDCTDGRTNWTTNWKVRVRIDPDPEVATQTTMTIRKAANGQPGGTYDATIVVPALVRFINTANNQPTNEISEVVTLSVTGASWANQPGTNGVNWTGGVTIDQGCGTSPGLSLPGTSSNFAAGWSNQCSPPCPTPVQHNGPHPVTPVPPPPPCTADVVSAAKLSVRTFPGTQISTVSAKAIAQPCQAAPVNGLVHIIGPDAIDASSLSSQNP